MPQTCGSARRNTWWQLGKGYGICAVVTGAPCVVAAVYFGDPSIVVGWFHFMLGLILLLSTMTALWVVTVYPFVLLLGWLFSRNDPPGPYRDPDGPGVIV